MSDTDRTRELVAAWHAANDRYNRLDRRWPWIKTAMWLLGAPAVILLALGWSALIPVLLTLAALALGSDQVLRMIHADRVRDAAQEALAEHTGLGTAELERLIDQTETEAGDVR